MLRKYSTSEAFLEEVQPEIAVISYGKNNPYGHPTKEAVERLKDAGAKIYYTGIQGATILRLEADGTLSIYGMLDP